MFEGVVVFCPDFFWPKKKCLCSGFWEKLERSEQKRRKLNSRATKRRILNKSLFLSRMHFTRWQSSCRNLKCFLISWKLKLLTPKTLVSEKVVSEVVLLQCKSDAMKLVLMKALNYQWCRWIFCTIILFLQFVHFTNGQARMVHRAS